jgi:hypothetical protein
MSTGGTPEAAALRKPHKPQILTVNHLSRNASLSTRTPTSMRALSSIPNLSLVSRNGRIVELCLDLPQEDADIFRLGIVARQGEDFLQLPAKMRAHRRLPEGPDFGFLEFAVARRQSVALKTIILRRQFHSNTARLFGSRTRAQNLALPSRFRGLAGGRIVGPLAPKTSNASFCSIHHATPRARAKACPRQEMNSRKRNQVRGPCAVQQRFQAERRPIWT